MNSTSYKNGNKDNEVGIVYYFVTVIHGLIRPENVYVKKVVGRYQILRVNVKCFHDNK